VKLNLLESADKLGAAAALHIENLMKEHALKGGPFCMALSGGRSPLTTYSHLASRDIDWSRVFIFLTDERYVKRTDADSNFRSINDVLFSKIKISAGNIIAPDTGVENPGRSADSYESAVRDIFASLPANRTNGGLPVFDLVCLGAGDDGHTASIFPDTEEPGKDRCVMNTTAPLYLAVKDRITFTLSLINNAANIMFIISGGHKGMMIRRILEGGIGIPASRVRGDAVVFTDRETFAS
jgi:6-phosphogluconolactonase